jgi:hypothetical protein
MPGYIREKTIYEIQVEREQGSKKNSGETDSELQLQINDFLRQVEK